MSDELDQIVERPEQPKKRGRPATGRGDVVGVRMTTALRTAVDEWAAALPDTPSRPEAIRRLVERALRAERGEAPGARLGKAKYK